MQILNQQLAVAGAAVHLSHASRARQQVASGAGSRAARGKGRAEPSQAGQQLAAIRSDLSMQISGYLHSTARVSSRSKGARPLMALLLTEHL